MSARHKRGMAALSAGLLAMTVLGTACTGNGGGGGGGGQPSTSGGVTRETDPAFPTRTIYRPTNLTGAKLPIIVWGQGGCMLAGDRYDPFQREIASHGYLIVADNLPGKTAQTTPAMLRQSIGLAIAENTRPGSKYQGKLDTTKIAAMGQSCGGLEALSIGDDPRLTTVVAWNSGIFRNGTLPVASPSDLNELHTPTMWVNGGTSDVAYAQAQEDFRLSKVPSVWANFPAGHTGTYGQAQGGEFAKIGVVWLDWQLKGKTENQAQLVGPDCGFCNRAVGTQRWTIQSKNWN